MHPSSCGALWWLRRLNSGHHLFLRDQMIDPLQQSQQTLHVSTPLVQDIICVSWLGEIDDPGRSINLGVDSLRSDQLADVFLRLVFRQVEQLGQSGHLNAGIVFGDDTDIVLNDTLAEILPSLVGLLVRRLTRSNIEDIGAAEVRTKEL